VKLKKPDKEKLQLQEKFYRLMFELNLFNKFNRTYYLSSMEKTTYGYIARLYLEPGLSFAKLQESISVIQENLKCLWIMQYEQLAEYAAVKIVTLAMDKYLPYENPNIKPWEMYLGLDFSQNPIINNNDEHQMFLLAGAIGTGKTRFINMILLSWILGCSVNQVEIYLSDIAKNEYVNFQYIKHVRYYASDLERLYKMMQYLKIKVDKRIKTITKAREEGWATNITEYNKVSKSKLSYCYIVIDEFSVIAPDKSDNKEDAEMKQGILDVLKRISKIGRSLGIFCLICLQKTSKEEMGGLSILKNMSAVRISFRSNDRVSSEVIVGDSSAVGIADRYAIYSLNGGDRKDYLYSPYLSTEQLKELLKPHEDRNFRKVDIDTELSAYQEQQTMKPKSQKTVPKHHYEVIDSQYSKDFIKVSGDDLLDY
jgi:S-DNA-T family DNA segregation ATPase FtsK/SpoIIIE